MGRDRELDNSVVWCNNTDTDNLPTLGGSWAILQLILGKVAAISLQLILVIVAAIFGQSCSIFWADLQLISYD